MNTPAQQPVPAPAPANQTANTGGNNAAPPDWSWKDLTEFISQQTQKDHELIDRWFKLAVGILSFIVFIAAALIGLFGWKTLGDAKAAAENSANQEARRQVRARLGEPDIQKLIQDEAKKLFREGAFRQAIESETASQLQRVVPAEVGRQIPAAILKEQNKADRTSRVTEPMIAAYVSRLSQFSGKVVSIEHCIDSEPTKVALLLKTILTRAGLSVGSLVPMSAQRCHARSEAVIVATRDFAALAESVGEFLVRLSGKKPDTVTVPEGSVCQISIHRHQ